MKKVWNDWKWLLSLLIGCVILAVSFNAFLMPNEINGGGLTGLCQILVELTGFGSVGLYTALINIPLFLIGGKKIGKRFFFGSLVGVAALSVLFDATAFIPIPETEPLLGALYGGVTVGIGMGFVYKSTVSTGGTDIIVRLLKRTYPNFSIGSITLALDLTIAVLTGIVFKDFSKTLYSIVVLFVASKVIDAVLYSFDYSKVAMIITGQYEKMAAAIDTGLHRGVTYLKGQGYYSGNDTKVILVALKRQQVAELKDLASRVDPNAFIIIQEAHQVLGDGFKRYNKDDL